MASSAEVISFRLSYPEFKALTDADMWAARDFPTARRLWVAHNLAIYAIIAANQAAMGDLAGFMNQAMQTVSFGERRVGFRQLRTNTPGDKYASGPLAQLAETAYGEKFLLLQSRNIFGVMTV